jgi:hypothetical protein
MITIIEFERYHGVFSTIPSARDPQDPVRCDPPTASIANDANLDLGGLVPEGGIHAD